MWRRPCAAGAAWPWSLPRVKLRWLYRGPALWGSTSCRAAERWLARAPRFIMCRWALKAGGCFDEWRDESLKPWRSMIAEIIAVGSEMLTPFRQDTNSLYLTERLNELGVQVAFKTIVGDNLGHLAGAAKIAIARADVVIFSGGLGPTEDDQTREAVGEALGLGLRRDNDILTAMYKRFAGRRMAMPANNAKQADRLEGAEVLANANGSAPGQYIDTVVGRHRKIVILLPGPPKELKAMYEAECRGRLAASLPERHMAKRMLRMALIPESQVDARTAPIYQQYSDVETTILAGSGEIQLHFQCVKASDTEAQARVDELAEKIEAEMGEEIGRASCRERG